MNYRRRFEARQAKARRRQQDEAAERMMYYEQRLRRVESILSNVYGYRVNLVVVNGWVKFNGVKYRVNGIEDKANKLEALCAGLK